MDRSAKLLPLIAAFKIGKACLLFTLAFGLHHLRNGNVQEILNHWAEVVRIDPENGYSQTVITKITGLPARRLHELGVGTFLYGLMFATEGFGLLFKQRWAEYLTIVSTTLFLPLEVFELFHPGRKIAKTLLLIFNVLIVIYLIRNLFKAWEREAKLQATQEPATAKS